MAKQKAIGSYRQKLDHYERDHALHLSKINPTVSENSTPAESPAPTPSKPKEQDFLAITIILISDTPITFCIHKDENFIKGLG